MKGRLLVLGRHAGRRAAALVVDGQLQEVRIDPPEGMSPPPETIWRGRVGRPVKGLGGVFVDLADGASGFLRETSGLRPGQPVLVQATGVAEPGKAVPLAGRLLVKGRWAIVTPGAPGLNVSRAVHDADRRARLEAIAARAMADAPADWGLILRTAAEGPAPDEDIAAEIAHLRQQAAGLLAAGSGPPALLRPAPDVHAIARRDWCWPAPDIIAEGPDAWTRHGCDDLVEALADPRVPLTGGGSMWIEPTRALLAVDVNTGPDTTPAAALKANLAALRELPRQLRLRGLGGQVVIDLAPCPRRDRAAIEQALRAALRRDGGELQFAGWTPLGHVELRRRRDRPVLADCL